MLLVLYFSSHETSKIVNYTKYALIKMMYSICLYTVAHAFL